MWVALLAAEEASWTDYEDTSEEDEEAEAQLQEAETELLGLYDKLRRNFEEKTGLDLFFVILSPDSCDRIPTLPIAGSEGSYACDGRCCVFALDGMQTLTKAGKKFDKKSECRTWSQY